MYIFDESDEFFRFPGGSVVAPGTVDLSIKLLRGEARGVRVCLYSDEQTILETEMDFSCAAGSYDVYKYRLHIGFPGLYWYNFRIHAADGGTVFVPGHEGSAYQITTCAPAVATPDWIHGGLIYHIFVDRFNRVGDLWLRPGAEFRPDWGGRPNYLPDENGIVKNCDFFGGNLYGIIEKLPYLEELGVTCIYLSPIFDAASNHKYDTGDYMHVDRAFGGDEAFALLCAAAGDRGMKIVLDGVFNHVGIDSRYFNRYGNYDTEGAYQGQHSEYYGWFNFRDDGKYDAWWDIELLPAVNKSSESYREYICGQEGVISKWTKAGVSGWRLDVVDELPDVFLDPLCEAIRRENSEALIIGEVWEDASNKIAYDVRRRYFLGGQLDSVTNYPIKDAIIDFIKYGRAEHLAAVMASVYRNYPRYICQSLMNVLGSHDTARILTVLSGADMPHDKRDMEHFSLSDAQLRTAKKKLKSASALQFTLPGVPCVYYGDEVGMEGCSDPFNRRCYPWGHEDAELLGWYKKLSRIRKSNSCFISGAYSLVEARAGLYAFIRGEGAGRVLVAVNTTENDRTLNADGFNYDLINDEHIGILAVKAGEPGIFSITKGNY